MSNDVNKLIAFSDPIMSIFKIILVLTLICLSIFIAGMTGILFKIWPVTFDDKNLVVNEAVLQKLEAMRREQRFLPDWHIHYPGAPNEDTRKKAETIVNSMIDDVAKSIKRNPKKSSVLAAVKHHLSALYFYDSEERERTADYVEQIIEICQVSSTNELLNVWRFGWPYGVYK